MPVDHSAIERVQGNRMGKVRAPYLTSRLGPKGTRRWFFQPPSRDRAKGWTAIRLHDQFQRPIADELQAANACRELSHIYTRWRAGEPGYGPWRIDNLGRVVAMQPVKIRKGKNFKPGQVGAMVHDYYQHEIFTGLSKKTRDEYRIYLDLLVERFGDDDWRDITPGAARLWIRGRAIAGGPSGAHALYRTARAFLNKARLLYTEKGHPGIVLEHENPFQSLDLSLPTASLLVWPRAAIEAFVLLADELGQPSIGDALVMMSWLGTRRQDWIKWPATFFEQPLIAFRQDKTKKPLVLPWSMIPPLQARVTAAQARRTADAVTATTFFHDPQGLPWGKAGRFRDNFNGIRDELVKQHPTFPTRYYVGLVEGDPLCIPTAELTMRAMRHTCITLMHDAGIPRELIRGITGHEMATIDEVMACYTASTADQAAAALQMRLDHEAKGATA